ncbi:heparan-alpha-glucosaminide N-acetyltransferase domain-containing protein [Blautia liquoris]|uniref:heparan-alpha-glucosaminide N-acetyltransferase domain-containing protein n=1 Tax=Blautia liquoris TaxID=2779518 RepID=UPI002FE6E91A
MRVPDILYAIKILTPFGFPHAGFRSSDYFPLLPWIFLYLCGFFFHQIFMEHETWKRFAHYKLPCLSVIGSKTIWIYLLHQPLSMLICSLLFH